MNNTVLNQIAADAAAALLHLFYLLLQKDVLMLMTFARTLALETLTKSDFSFQVIFLFLSFAPTATATAVQLMVADAISKT